MKPVVMVIHVKKDGTLDKTKHTDVTVPTYGRIRWVTQYPDKSSGPKLRILNVQRTTPCSVPDMPFWDPKDPSQTFMLPPNFRPHLETGAAKEAARGHTYKVAWQVQAPKKNPKSPEYYIDDPHFNLWP